SAPTVLPGVCPLSLVPFVFAPPCRLGCEIEQRANCAGRCLSCAQLKDLSHQYQHGDDARGFKITGRRAAMTAECVRENLRDEGGGETVNVGDPGAHGDEREHVEVSRRQRLPTADEKWPAGPQ